MNTFKRCLSAFLIVLFAGSGVSVSASEQSQANNETAISVELLTDLFDRMRTLHWEADRDLVWGYFFADPSSEKLFAAAALLEQRGYRMAGVLGPTPEVVDQNLLFLRVEKIEKHTPQSLYERNAELRHFAKELGLEAYDGMNVGPISNESSPEKSSQLNSGR